MRVVHRDSNESAIARLAPSGCVLVQFNRMSHPQSHGWHLYPRHHFRRRRWSDLTRIKRGPDV